MHRNSHQPASPNIRAASPGGAESARPFWARNAEASLGRRIANIQKINDPTTNADEVLRAAKIFITLLLAFTGLLGGMNYYKVFGLTFPPAVTLFLAVVVTITIEFGKNYCTLWALRQPFFQGFGRIAARASSFIIWTGLAALAVATFSMSIWNSTRGAEHLALLLAHQRPEAQATFTPDTRDLDAQIIAAQNAQTAALGNKITTGKYKGMTEWNSATTAKKAGATVAALSEQRKQVVEQQRADWERRQTRTEQHNDHAAGLVLRVGGWVELLQLLLMVVRVACERSLDGRTAFSPTPAANRYHNNGHVPENHDMPRFFNRGGDGNVIRARAHPADVVTQSPFVVSQHGAPTAVSYTPDAILRYYEQDLRRDTPNYNRPKGCNFDTVTARIHQKLRNAHADIDRTQVGAFSAAAAKRFADYLTKTLEPILAEQNSPYDSMQDMLASLRHKTATEGEAVIS